MEIIHIEKQAKHEPKVQYPFEVKRLKLRHGKEISFADEGEGKETIVFIHGLAGYLPLWQHNINFFRKTHRVVALDLPGQGLSSKGQHPYSLVFYIETLKELLDELELEQVVLCGHSMGGQIAALFALRHPKRVSRLILAAPAGIETFSGWEKLLLTNYISLMGSGLAKQHLQWVLNHCFWCRPNNIKTIISDLEKIYSRVSTSRFRQIISGSVNGMLKMPLKRFLPLLQMPVLMIFGEQDMMIPNPYLHRGSLRGMAEAAAKAIAQCQLLLIPQCGHLPHLEKPSDFNRAVRQFLFSGKEYN